MLGGFWQELRSHSHFIIGHRQFMELTLQLVRDHIQLVEIGVGRRPSGRCQVDAPTAFARPQEGLVCAMQRGWLPPSNAAGRRLRDLVALPPRWP